MRQFKYILFLIVSLPFLTFCSNDNYNENLLKPKSSKDLGEILIVLEKKYWSSEIYDKLKTNFSKLITTTPLPYEKEFNLDLVSPNGLNKTIKKCNAIIMIDVSDKNDYIEYVKPTYDLWAKNQIVFNIKANSITNIVNYLEAFSTTIKQDLNKFYYKIITSEYSYDTEVNKTLLSKHKIKLAFPSGVKIKKHSENFTWLNKLEIKKKDGKNHEIQKGFFIYSLPYTNKNIFSENKQIYIRDSLLKKYVLGEKSSNYMITRKDELAKICSTSLLYNSEYIFEINGLWRVVNDRMGGPFVSISLYDEINKRVIIIEGYVYAPNFTKSDLIREVKAVLYSYIITQK